MGAHHSLPTRLENASRAELEDVRIAAPLGLRAGGTALARLVRTALDPALPPTCEGHARVQIVDAPATAEAPAAAAAPGSAAPVLDPLPLPPYCCCLLHEAATGALLLEVRPATATVAESARPCSYFSRVFK